MLPFGNVGVVRTEMQLKIAVFKQYKLKYKEINIAVLITDGLTNQEIAEKVYLKEKTIKEYTSRIYRKCSVARRTQLIVLIFRGIMGLRDEDTSKIFNRD